MDERPSFADNLAFQLVKLGAWANTRYGERLAELGMRPRQVGVLELLKDGPVAQLHIAERLGVAHSVVVDMLDELETLGAVQRVRDPGDRRRYIVTSTEDGMRLAGRALALAHEVDSALLAAVPAKERPAIRCAIGELARGHARADRVPATPAQSSVDPPRPGATP